jgi:phenylalanyl-tRNA synthetase alpha chain
MRFPGAPIVLEEKIQALHSSALQQLAAATTLEAVEAVRIEALGRKGKLAELSKELGKLPPQERGPQGKVLNSAKQDLESRIDARKANLEEQALAKRLDA